ncbi:MAG TPA: SH3 domain-containing protein [Planctomycetota bacterium]|nr:SH3 domain-containing protein [Planctomycetota bacterium]
MKLLGAAFTGILLLGPMVAAEDDTFAGEVTANTLNLRAGPGEAYQPVVTVSKGAKLIVLGQYPNDPAWSLVEVPAGYTAWVSSDLVKKGDGGTGEVTASRVLVRPRPSTRYHQLSGRLEKGEAVTILEEKKTDSEGLWYRIRVPRRFPLYAAARFLNKIGPASLAEVKEEDAAAAPALTLGSTAADAKFEKLEPGARAKLKTAKTAADVELVRTSVATIDASELSPDNRDKRVKLLSDVLDKERMLAIEELRAKETELNTALDSKLSEIDKKYKRRLAEIREEFEREKKPRYVATGIVKFVPDIVGRYPSYRLVEGDKMRYYLIANQFDLGRFVNKRVGVIGITDPESGTGYETVMVKRIEILADE